MNVEYYENLIKDKYKEKFEKFYELLVNYNNMYNLTAITEKNQVFLKHFLDSALAESLFDKNSRVAEIGSGGGFPSIPLKILREDLSFTLIESTYKKCEYLKVCVDKLELNSVEVLNLRAEDGARDNNLREKFDICTARAVAKLNTLCEYCLPYVKVGGKFIAYKGSENEIEEAFNALKVLGGKIEKTENYSLPNGDKRCIIVIKKVAPTPLKYPRGQGRERKKPL